MKTLRAKLFVSIGTILLATTLFNTAISQFWIKNDMTKSGKTISDHFEEVQEHIRQFGSFLLTFHIIDQAIELERISDMPFQDFSFTQKNTNSPWDLAKKIISYAPNISFVQIQNSEGTSAIITPKDANLYSFFWAPGEENSLWVKVTGGQELFIATPYQKNEQTFYLLFEAKTPPPKETDLSFHEVIIPSSSYDWKEAPSSLFQTLLLNKNQWLEKIDLIEELLPWQEESSTKKPLGILQMSSKHHLGGCLLADEVFSTSPIIPDTFPKEPQELPFLILRDTSTSKDLDMFRVILAPDQSKNTITLGFSLSSLLQEVSLLVNRTIIGSGNNFSIGFSPEGKIFDPQKEQFPFKELSTDNAKLSWDNKSYFFSTIDLTILKLFILIPEEQASSFDNFLSAIRSSMIFKILISLSVSSLFSFAIALFFLNNISKKITNPIAMLSKASEELSKGTYEGLILPEINHRKDEVSTLAKSFQGMVTALKDRDKIRGVLNKVVSKEISEEILKHNIELSGEEKILTLLFSDIRNFTHLAEGMLPHILIKMLNDYMTRMCRIIDATHGVVDKFVGDEIMTLYGAPIALDFHAAQAIEAALWMMQDLSEWNLERRQNNKPIFEIGIGIHTGLVYTGNMGAENRLNYTAIGANVNQASRICSVALPMQILISEETLKAKDVEERFLTKKLEPVLLKGIQNPVQLYEVLGKKTS